LVQIWRHDFLQDKQVQTRIWAGPPVESLSVVLYITTKDLARSLGL
jgi:hypothetical protein